MDARQADASPGGTAPAAGLLVTVRYWAGARSAAGVDAETVEPPGSVADLTSALAAAHPDLGSVLPVCSLLVDGLAATATDPVPPGALVEVLPPFAGG